MLSTCRKRLKYWRLVVSFYRLGNSAYLFAIIIIICSYRLLEQWNESGEFYPVHRNFILSNNSPLDGLWTQSQSEFQPPDCHSFNLRIAGSSGSKSWTPHYPHTDQSILDIVKDCEKLKRHYSFPDAPFTEAETSFPLAYVFVGERNADQTLRLFRALYWPQNAFCFTYDNKSSILYKKFMHSLAACFPENVQMNPNPVDVYWGEESILKNVMGCLGPLMNNKIIWRYLQIVSYNDFPLKTNLEMVNIMQILNGSNDCELTTPRVDFYKEKYGYGYGSLQKTKRSKNYAPPHGIVLFKGSYAAIMSREFISFILNSRVAVTLYDWMEGVWCPEEIYWSTLIHNTAFDPPGGFPGSCLWYYDYEKKAKQSISRCQVWTKRRGHACRGKSIHGSCVFGVKDLDWLFTQPELIAHKFYQDFQPATLYCMERWHWEKTWSKSLDYIAKYGGTYADLPGVRYQNAVDKNKYAC